MKPTRTLGKRQKKKTRLSFVAIAAFSQAHIDIVVLHLKRWSKLATERIHREREREWQAF